MDLSSYCTLPSHNSFITRLSSLIVFTGWPWQLWMENLAIRLLGFTIIGFPINFYMRQVYFCWLMFPHSPSPTKLTRLVFASTGHALQVEHLIWLLLPHFRKTNSPIEQDLQAVHSVWLLVPHWREIYSLFAHDLQAVQTLSVLPVHSTDPYFPLSHFVQLLQLFSIVVVVPSHTAYFSGGHVHAEHPSSPSSFL